MTELLLALYFLSNLDSFGQVPNWLILIATEVPVEINFGLIDTFYFYVPICKYCSI